MKALLESVADVFNGKTPSKAEQRDSGHPVLKIRDIDEIGAFRGPMESFVDYSFAEKHKEKQIQGGDTLILNAAHNADYVASKICFAPAEAVGALATGEWLIIRPNKSVADDRYMFRWVNGSATRRALRDLVNGIHLYPKDVARLQIDLPPLPVQRRIADILDRADALRAKRRAALARLDELTQTIFVEMFGDPAVNPKHWPLRTVGSLASKFSDGPFGSNLKSSHYVESGIRVIRLQNIGVGRFVDEDRAYISTEHFEDLAKHECRPGDVLIGTLGDPNLRACIQPQWLSVALNKADCVQLRADESVALPRYISALLNHPSVERMAQSLMLGQTRVRISMGRLRDLNVPIAPLAIQRRYVEIEGSIDDLRAQHERSAQHADNLFASLQDRAFRGTL